MWSFGVRFSSSLVMNWILCLMWFMLMLSWMGKMVCCVSVVVVVVGLLVGLLLVSKL